MRLDHYISIHFPYTRSRAQMLITSGSVDVCGIVITKSSFQILETLSSENVVITDTIRYVSRAGLKLEFALQQFSINVSGKTFLDIGASTGGFTDCLLQNNAQQVVCVDVGSGQLHESLRMNKKITFFELTDIRNFSWGKPFDGVVCDVSFISLLLIIPELDRFIKKGADIILLIKPQFEVGKEFLNKQGVVKNTEKIQQVINTIKNTLEKNSITVQGIIPSPITGGDGNQEFLLYGIKN